MDELLIVRQRYTPFGGGERFLDQALQVLAGRGLRIRVLCREWSGDAPYEVTRLPVTALTRTQRDRAFARLACAHVAAAPRALVQSHERIACCDIYRAGDGVHREWLTQRARARGRLSALFDRLSPYHRYVLGAERRLFRSRRLNTVICNSHMVRDEIQRHFGVPDERLVVIHNGVDTQRYSPALRAQHRATQRARLGIPDQAPVFLFVGSGYERKGLDACLQALARAPGAAHLVVVGKDRHARRYQARAARLGIADRVLFSGAQTEMPPFYGAADALLLPTLYDPFPNVVLEAMASGLPVVISEQCGARDIVSDGVNGLRCDALDIDCLAGCLQRLLDDAERVRLGSAARATVEPMSLERTGDALLALYTRVLATARG